jgi:ribonuclease P protein component
VIAGAALTESASAMERLTKRAEFLAVARGSRSARRAFVLQALGRSEADTPPRAGFTVTKKVGNAVERNRIRRRLREVVRLHGMALADPGTDYVLVGRREALSLPFAALVEDFASAIRQARKQRRKAEAREPARAPGIEGTAGSDPADAAGLNS